MTLILFNTTLITLVISCLTAVSPINLGVIIIITAIIVATITAIISTSWFGFITFIIYVGGILVIFAYFAALQPNQPVIRWSWLLTPLIILIIIAANINNTPPIHYINNLSTTELYNLSNLTIPLLLALTLFLALIIVVKVSHADEGPLRPFQYV